MATSKRTYPNDYFAWYNDDARLAIVARVLSTDSTTTVDDIFDTYVDDSIDSGNDILRIHYHSKYIEVSSLTHNLTTNSGLDSGLHPALVDYVKSRLLEDAGDLQRASYFKGKYDKKYKTIPTSKNRCEAVSCTKVIRRIDGNKLDS